MFYNIQHIWILYQNDFIKLHLFTKVEEAEQLKDNSINSPIIILSENVT